MQQDKENLYNEYTVYFRKNQPLTVWAKSFKKYIDSGIEVLYFENEYNGEAVLHINPVEVLYIKAGRRDVSFI